MSYGDHNYKNSSELSILDSIASNSIADLTSNILEIALDQFISNEVISSIPIVGSIVGLGKAGLSIRDRLFARKVCSFLLQINDKSEKERMKLVREIEEQFDKKQSAGEAILLMIDQADSSQKTALMGRLFSKKIEHDEFSSEELLHLCFILNKLYWTDILKFKEPFMDCSNKEFKLGAVYDISHYNQFDIMDEDDEYADHQRLASAGLLVRRLPRSREDEAYHREQRQAYFVSLLGQILLKYGLLPDTTLCGMCHGEGKVLENEGIGKPGVITRCGNCAGAGRVLPE